MVCGVLRGRHQFEVVGVVVRLVLVLVVDVLAAGQKPSEPVLHEDPMQRVKALLVAIRVRRLGPAIAVSAALADGKNLEHVTSPYELTGLTTHNIDALEVKNS